MRALMIVLLAAWLGAPASAQTPAPPDWMSGYWLSCAGDEQVAETWFGAGSGMLLGMNLTQSARGRHFEMLRIGPSAAGYSYFSMPDGAAATEFALKSAAGRRVVFENLAHDFPQRILYWREGNVLNARIEGEINGRAESAEWRFRRAKPDSNCPRR